METTTATRQPVADAARNDDGTTSITVPAPDLARAIAWVAPAAAKDSARNTSYYIGINLTFGHADYHAPHFEPAKGWKSKLIGDYAISVAATDRYRLHWATVNVPAIEDTTVGVEYAIPSGSITLPAKELATVAKTWPKPSRATIMPNRIRITFIEDDSLAPVRFDVLEPAADIVVASQTIRPDSQQTFPKYARLVPAVDNTTSAASVAWDPAFMADLASTAKTLKLGTLAFHLPAAEGKNVEQVQRACLIVPNDDSTTVSYAAILMPVKF